MSDHIPPLFKSFQLGDLELQNRIVMSSLTRGRATNPELVPTAIMADYYGQRASAGLIITEGTWVSKKAIGFINVPGIYTEKQVEGWKLVTDAVHKNNGKIFVQLGHCGSASHPDFFDGEIPRGPSAINPQLQSFTPEGFKDTVTPVPFTLEEIKETVNDYRKAAENALKAGFDGVEIHAQIYTLIPQFLSAATNQRKDEYGGSIENRSRILFEIIEALKTVWPTKRIGLKFTPAAFNPGILVPDSETIATYQYILKKLNSYDLGYVQWVAPAVDLAGTVIEALDDDYFAHPRTIYKGSLMANGGFTFTSGNKIIEEETADLVSFGMPFIANPDLAERFKQNLPLATADPETFYAGGETGYTDYPNAI
ncbi:alkene reductase [Pedobacter sp. UBA5917]|jgi:N-ethylmaleimide reductase|uniref:alkene reductase n=1 Tax=Pedobacter sp. UBA5917 TaxID=1947061 RepID=UPI0025EE80AE|nr:alkene reductase [Pedobacter sp. UBA5917]